jgi:uncharacterized protein YcfL
MKKYYALLIIALFLFTAGCSQQQQTPQLPEIGSIKTYQLKTGILTGKIMRVDSINQKIFIIANSKLRVFNASIKICKTAKTKLNKIVKVKYAINDGQQVEIISFMNP